jgi:hypothetical protein
LTEEFESILLDSDKRDIENLVGTIAVETGVVNQNGFPLLLAVDGKTLSSEFVEVVEQD